MKYIKSISVGICLLCLPGLYPGINAATIKCWIDNEGVRACGTTVPPEYAQQGHQEFSSQGLVINEQARAKTEEEIAEEARIAAIEEEKQKFAEEQIRQDRILLDTFSNVDDIKVARDEKIAAIEASISLAMKRNEKIEADLENRMKAAAAAERNGQAPNEALLEDIESLKRQASNNQEFINGKHIEKQEMQAAYDTDIKRFQELKQDR